jgi:drug/metabolite transporter (DMT)-like permease
MLAIVGAICFGLALILNVGKVDQGDVFNAGNLTLLGFLLVALHLAGFATAWRPAATRGRRYWARR